MIILNLIRLNVVSRKYFGRTLRKHEQVRNKRNAYHQKRTYHETCRRYAYEARKRNVHYRISRTHHGDNDEIGYQIYAQVAEHRVHRFLEQQIASVYADCTIHTVFFAIFNAAGLFYKEINEIHQHRNKNENHKALHRRVKFFFVLRPL